MEDKKIQCYACAYRRAVPGSVHIRCTYDWIKAGVSVPKGNSHGIQSGWYNFPLNYDPVWMDEECLFVTTVRDPDMTREKYSPMVELFSLLDR
jgi:hypothetical protein